MDVIDQDSDKNHSRNASEHDGTFNLPSLLLICFSVGIVFYTILEVRYQINNPHSPWLPEYTPYFTNGQLINFSIIQFGGIAPALYLRLKKKYSLSLYFMVAFLFAAKLLENNVDFYWKVFSIFQ